MADISLPLNLKTVVSRGIQLHEQEEGHIYNRVYNLVNVGVAYNIGYDFKENISKGELMLSADIPEGWGWSVNGSSVLGSISYTYVDGSAGRMYINYEPYQNGSGMYNCYLKVEKDGTETSSVFLNSGLSTPSGYGMKVVVSSVAYNTTNSIYTINFTAYAVKGDTLIDTSKKKATATAIYNGTEATQFEFKTYTITEVKS